MAFDKRAAFTISESRAAMRMYQPPKEGDLEEIKIELTRDCLLNCIHCSSNASAGNSVQLSRHTVLSLVEQASDMGVKGIVFSGGEPLLWPGIADAVSACSERNLRASIYSTGIVKSGNGAQAILELARLGLKRVVFSLYSSEEERHEAITRKRGSFDKTVSVMRDTQGSIEREIHVVPLVRNYQELPALIRLAKHVGIYKVSVLRFVPQGRGVMLKRGREALSRNETVILRKLIADSRNGSGVNVRTGSPYNICLLDRDVDCIAARQTLCISPLGNIYPCDAFKSIEPEDMDLGDEYNSILRHSLKDCWERSAYLNAVRAYLSTPFEEPCMSCPRLEFCKSGCLAQKVLEQESIKNGSIAKMPDPLCLRDLITGG